MSASTLIPDRFYLCHSDLRRENGIGGEALAITNPLAFGIFGPRYFWVGFPRRGGGGPVHPLVGVRSLKRGRPKPGESKHSGAIDRRAKSKRRNAETKNAAQRSADDISTSGARGGLSTSRMRSPPPATWKALMEKGSTKS